MSGKHDIVLEDKYDKKSHSFKNTEKIQSLDDFQKLHGLESDIKKKAEEEQKNKPQGIVQRKLRRIFGALTEVKGVFFQGFKMGFIVGGIFGGLMGTYYAISYRSIMFIPSAAIGSGCSFGFFMGLGMILRTEMEGNNS